GGGGRVRAWRGDADARRCRAVRAIGAAVSLDAGGRAVVTIEQEEFDLPLPLGGISDDLAFSKQKLSTTREAFNNRSEDSPTGREMPAQRSGQSKAVDAQLEAGVKVAEMSSVVFDSRNLSYVFSPGSESQEWIFSST